MADILELPIAKLRRRADARAADPATVKALANSIGDMGVMNPLRVRSMSIFESGTEGDGWEIIAGRHRYEGALKAGLQTVPCIVVQDDDLRAELAMIDENLCRAELSPADRAAQTARRKAIYIELHPETARGVAGGLARQGSATDNLSFAAETSAATGKTERSVQRDAERGEKVCARAIDMVRGTQLDTGTYLDKLKKVESDDEQVETVARALAGIARAQEREKAEVFAKRSQSRIDADVKHRAAREVAEILAEHVPAELWAGLKANLYAAKKASDIADELTNITGQAMMADQPVMDRRFG